MNRKPKRGTLFRHEKPRVFFDRMHRRWLAVAPYRAAPHKNAEIKSALQDAFNLCAFLNGSR
jgi:hypothetical protein